jgi:single-strand DNA-binding protein
MSGYIGITVVGNVVANPELRAVGQSQVCKFKIAANTGFGEKKSVAFFSVDVWGKAGESVSKYLTKGKQTMVTGNLTVREYETKDGKKGVSLEIRASDVVFLGSADGQPKQEDRTPAASTPGVDDTPF